MNAYFERRGLRVPIIETGCVGYCQREVFVDLVTADGVRLSYCDLGPDTIDEWLQTVFGDGELHNRFLLGRYDDPDDLYRGVQADRGDALLRAADQGRARRTAASSTPPAWTPRWPPAASAPPPGRWRR